MTYSSRNDDYLFSVTQYFRSRPENIEIYCGYFKVNNLISEVKKLRLIALKRGQTKGLRAGLNLKLCALFKVSFNFRPDRLCRISTSSSSEFLLKLE